ncbi:hypothetical protein [Herbaspirillum sp. C7C8]|uniref:hypothetical protein n=1 Tax=Herbaspirillum sp. C7C8 TaxID=2736665 RepID=UPI001F51C010|nr:hypothetical protein [Herbaspirillum sp. C7C8]MCI1003281.1 hypothetical protein [Herbaspirillum sp. C7C8]
MSFFYVRVKRGPFSGKAADGVRLNILPGEYEVIEDGPDLVFLGADTRNGGNVVDMRDYPEIGDFPEALGQHSQIVLVK